MPTGSNSHSTHHDYTPERLAAFAQFAEEQGRKRSRPRPPAFSDAEHIGLSEALLTEFIPPRDARNTKIAIKVVEKKWKAYCDDKIHKPWHEWLEGMHRGQAMTFCLYMCESGDINSEYTLHIYWNQFKQFYYRAIHRHVDKADSDQVLAYIMRVLVPRFDLKPKNADGQPMLGMRGLHVLLNQNVAYDTGRHGPGRHRVQRNLWYILLKRTGCRNAELVDGTKKEPEDSDIEEEQETPDDKLLKELLRRETADRDRCDALCYEDVRLMVVRHPVSGKDVLVMQVKFIHHKGHGRKPKPTVFTFSPRKAIIRCAVTHMVSLALADKAFAAKNLTSARDVFSVRSRGREYTPIYWKPELQKVPIFRNSKAACGDITKEPTLSAKITTDDSKEQSLDAGFQIAATQRCARRGALNDVNVSEVDDNSRDQMARHDPGWLTFNGAYLNEHLMWDIEAATDGPITGEEPDNNLVRELGCMSITRDPRAPRKAPREFVEALPPDEKLTELERELSRLQREIPAAENAVKIRKTVAAIARRKKRIQELADKDYRKHYFLTRPTEDIERDSRGEVIEEYVPPATEYDIPERNEWIEVMCRQPENLSEKELLERRIKAADTMAAYSCRIEMPRDAIIRKRRRSESNMRGDAVLRERRRSESDARQAPPEDPCAVMFRDLQQASRVSCQSQLPNSPSPDPMSIGPKTCPYCRTGKVRNGKTLTWEQKSFRYSTTNKMFDHCKREHEPDPAPLRRRPCGHECCPGVVLDHHDHWKAHLESKHGARFRLPRGTHNPTTSRLVVRTRRS